MLAKFTDPLDSPSLARWIEAHPIPESMYYQGMALKQLDAFQGLAADINARATVLSTHTSKSIELPVVSLWTEHGFVVLSDNFHGVSLSMWMIAKPRVSFVDVYPKRDWDWYLEQVARKRNYTFAGWSDEEMEDPRILRVQVRPRFSPESPPYWRSVSAEAKDAWANRMVSTDWFHTCWSSSRLLLEEGSKMGPGCVFFELKHFSLRDGYRFPAEMSLPWNGGEKGSLAFDDFSSAAVFVKRLFLIGGADAS